MRSLRPLSAPSHGRGGAPKKRDQIWQRQYAADVRERANQRIADLLDEVGPSRALAETCRYVSARRAAPGPHSQLDAFCHAVALLEQLAAAPTIELELARELLSSARAILADQSIDPRRSRVAELCADVERCAADIARRGHDHWSANWHDALAGLSSRSEAREPLRSAENLALLAGDAPALVSRVLSRELTLEQPVELTAMRARLLRLSGRLEQARAILDSAEQAPEILWESAVLDAVEKGSLNRMATLLRKRPTKKPARQLDFWLWAHAHSSRRWREQSVKLATISRRLDEDPAALRCATAIAELTRRTQQPLERLRRLGATLRQSTAVRSVERELLIWAAAARCLGSAKQPRFAEVAAARYVALSRVASAGDNADVLGLFIAVPAALVPASWEELELGARHRPMPARARDRYLECGKIALDLARARLRHATGQTSNKRWNEDVADLLTDHLSHLKGPLLKLGQLMTHYGLGLSDEERMSLGALYDQAGGVGSTEIIKVLESELGPVATRFTSFETAPFAAGSIGQVHRARTSEGREVAVKVQYPDIEHAIAGDLRLLKALAPLLARLLPKWNVRALLAELETMILAECDYKAEADNQRRFIAMFDDCEDISIPEVIASHSSARVLTTELVRGERIEDFAARSEAPARREAAERVARFIVRTGIVRRLAHTDPHPGNFLITPETLHVLDFGSTKTWPSSHWRDVLLACMQGDAAALQLAFEAMGMIAGPLDCENVIRQMRRYTMRWTVRGPSEFGSSDVASEIKTWLMDGSMSNLVVQPADLFGFRMYWGAFALLAKFNVTVDLAAVVDAELAMQAELDRNA